MATPPTSIRNITMARKQIVKRPEIHLTRAELDNYRKIYYRHWQSEHVRAWARYHKERQAKVQAMEQIRA